jgi:hypothetical protein
LDQIIASFGDVHNYIQPDGMLDPRWQTEFIDRVALPFPLLLSWDHSKSVRQFACHKRLTAVFGNVFANILAEELQAKVKASVGVLHSGRSGPVLSFRRTVGELPLI